MEVAEDCLAAGLAEDCLEEVTPEIAPPPISSLQLNTMNTHFQI